MLLVLGIMGVVGAMGAAQIAEARRSMQGDGAMRLVMSQFNLARQMAVTQRRNMQLQFVGTNWMQIVRQEVPAGSTTLVSQAFEGNVTYRIVPSVTLDTPDGFGKTAASLVRVLHDIDHLLVGRHLDRPVRQSVERHGVPRRHQRPEIAARGHGARRHGARPRIQVDVQREQQLVRLEQGVRP